MITAVAAIAVFALVVWLLLKLVPGWLATSGTKAHQEEVGRVRTSLLALSAGVIAVIGAYYTHRTFLLNREGHITDRYARAIDQLGNRESLDVRLGGIYALERVARESFQDHAPIMEVLTAFVREHSGENEHEGRTQEVAPPALDIQAAMKVILRRKIDHDPAAFHLNLEGARLARADLEGADLHGADLGRAILSQAILTDANLGDTNLRGADLTYARLHQANLSDARANAANFSNADLSRANLSGADLTDATLTDADTTDACVTATTGFKMSGAVRTDVDVARPRT